MRKYSENILQLGHSGRDLDMKFSSINIQLALFRVLSVFVKGMISIKCVLVIRKSVSSTSFVIRGWWWGGRR